MPDLQKTKLSPERAQMVLTGLKGIGALTAHKLLQHFDNDPVRIFQASEKELKSVEHIRSSAINSVLNWQEYFDIEGAESALKKLGGDFIPYTSEDYPEALKNIYDPPIGLYRLGNYTPTSKCVAIVGSRRSTLYGLKTARMLAFDLAKNGYTIVSGMARGIDTAAHEGALEAEGHTVAVLGCGANVVYPPENKILHKNIQKKGAVLSEFPLGTNGDKYTFPMRNRIVSGLAQAVIIVETDKKGGSMITARTAGEQGRHVFAVPGRIDQTSSRGCHQLIRDGATLIQHSDDVLEELQYMNQGLLQFEQTIVKRTSSPIKKQHSIEGLTENETKVFNLLESGNILMPDHIAEHTQLQMPEVSAALMMLEIKRMLVKRADGKFEVV